MPRCAFCKGRGELKDPFLRGAYNTCPECGGSGWIPEIIEVEEEVIEDPLPEDPRIVEARRQRKREFDKYLINKFYWFFVRRPFELIAKYISSSREYDINWKHYISVLWWGLFFLTPLIYLNGSFEITSAYQVMDISMILGVYIIAIIGYYTLKSKVELP